MRVAAAAALSLVSDHCAAGLRPYLRAAVDAMVHAINPIEIELRDIAGEAVPFLIKCALGLDVDEHAQLRRDAVNLYNHLIAQVDEDNLETAGAMLGCCHSCLILDGFDCEAVVER